MRSLTGLAAGALLLAACSTSATPGPTALSETPTPAPSSAETAASPTSAGFTSAVYGYRADVPGTWTVSPAIAPWDGGDIDHTAPYADHLVDEAGNEYFVVAAPLGLPLAEAVDEHLAWLTDNRGCPAPSTRTAATIGGEAAERIAIHCPDGVFGPTLVSKAIAVHDGTVVIVSSFSPDGGADDFAPFDALLASVRWTDS